MLALTPRPQRPSGRDSSSCEQAISPHPAQPGGELKLRWCDSERQSSGSVRRDAGKDTPLAGSSLPVALWGALSRRPLPPASPQGSASAASLPHPGAPAACFCSVSRNPA